VGADTGDEIGTDRAAIENLLMRYALAVDTRDFDDVGDCFTPGARAFYSGVQLSPGVEHIVDHIRGISHFVESQHVFGASLIEIEGDRATSVSYATAYLVRAEADGHVALTRGLRYDDHLVRTRDGWRIDARVHRALWSAELPVTWPVPSAR
jgi:hypothetical protein